MGQADMEQRRAASADNKEDDMKYKGVKIKRRTDGRWYGRITLKPGKYHYVYGRTQQECYDKVKAMLDKPKLIKSMVKALDKTEQRPKRYKLKDWYTYWIRTYKAATCQESTLRILDYTYNNHLAVLGDNWIDEITAPIIQEFLANIKLDYMRLKCYKVLSDMIRKAVLLDVIKKSPLPAVIPPKYKQQERLAIEPEEQQRFIVEAQRSEYWTIYALMLFEGLRTGEAKALRHCDIKQDCIVVRSSLRENGEIAGTKTGTIRKVPIFAAFKPIADKLRSNSTALIFVKANKHTANDEYREIMQRLGMSYNMYALRHTFATNCARAGIVSKQVALWMGHTDVSTTLKYYTNISSSFEAENVKALDTVFDTNFDANSD